MIDIKRLRKLALEATPGEWRFDDGNLEIETLKGRHHIARLDNNAGEDCQRIAGVYQDGDYIAEAGPQTMLMLLDFIEHLQKLILIEDARDAVLKTGVGVPHTMAFPMEDGVLFVHAKNGKFTYEVQK